jgi:uncharacterized protein YfbU (UPF0304 family)
MKIEKIKTIKEVAKRIYFNFNVLNLSRIIFKLENATSRKKIRKIFINIERTSPYGLNVDDIVHTFFNEINEKKIEELVDVLIMYLYELIKSGDVHYEYKAG